MTEYYVDKRCPHCSGVMLLTKVHDDTSPNHSYLCNNCVLALLPDESDIV